MHHREGQRQAARHTHRRPDGRILARAAPQPAGDATVDYGTYPVAPTSTECHPERSEGSAVHSASLNLPPLDDAVSIQLALIDVAQGLAANRIDTKPFSQKMQACNGYWRSFSVKKSCSSRHRWDRRICENGKRAGLLLYALQVASANVKNVHIPFDSVRSVTFTEDGAPLAPQDYGYDVEDYEEEHDEDYDEGEE
jgi:hypothetical protein